MIEIMIVLVIIVMIMGLAISGVMARLAEARIKTTRTYIHNLESAIELYEVAIGRPPTTEQGLAALVSRPSDLLNPDKWAGPYIKDNATGRDPWGSEYQYVSPGRDGRRFDIWSFGPDGMDGTEDDIGSWMPIGNF